MYLFRYLGQMFRDIVQYTLHKPPIQYSIKNDMFVNFLNCSKGYIDFKIIHFFYLYSNVNVQPFRDLSINTSRSKYVDLSPCISMDWGIISSCSIVSF